MTTLPHPTGESSRAPENRSSGRDPGTFARAVGLDALYLIASGLLSVASFGLVFSLALVSYVLVIIYIGLFLLIVPMILARGFVSLQRQLVLWRGEDIPRPTYDHSLTSDPNSWMDMRGDKQYGRAMLQAISLVFVSVATLGVTSQLAFWSIVGVFSSIARTSELNEQGLSPVLIGVMGLLGIVALPFVIRALAAVQAGASMALMGYSRTDALRSRVSSLEQSRATAVKTEHRAFRRIERDLHDGPQQRLIRLGMDLDRVHRTLGDNAAAGTLLESARSDVQSILNEIRALSRGIAPPILVDRGLQVALESLAARSTIPTTLGFETTDQELSDLVSTTIYYVVAESLTNAAKHSGASRSHVHVSRHHAGGKDTVLVAIWDNGDGGAVESADGGISGLRARALTMDGTLSIESPVGGPTTVSMQLPLRSGPLNSGAV